MSVEEMPEFADISVVHRKTIILFIVKIPQKICLCSDIFRKNSK